MKITIAENPVKNATTEYYDCVLSIDGEEYEIRYVINWDKNTACGEKEICSIYKDGKIITDDNLLNEIGAFIA